MLPDAVDILLDSYPTIADLISALSELTGIPPEDMNVDLKQFLAARLFFLLLGEIRTATNFSLILKRIESRLSLGPDQAMLLAERMAAASSSTLTSQYARRTGLSDIPYPIRHRLFERQNHRCSVCGFSFRTCELPMRASSLGEPTLDHVVAYRLGGDNLSNLRVTCALCNGIKAEFMHVAERGRVWIGNHVFSQNLTVVAFWTLVRDGHCTLKACGIGPSGSRLFVMRRHPRGAFVLDNCMTRCQQHLDPDEAILY
jgi:hypothetical protein